MHSSFRSAFCRRPPLSDGHVLGTDQFGRDILARLVWGTRLSLMVALGATAVAATVGTIVGVVAGYAAGVIDTVLMRAIDVLLGFPYLVLALAVVAILGPGLLNALIAIAILAEIIAVVRGRPTHPETRLQQPA